MAESATVIILPRVSHDPWPSIDLAHQVVAPSADRRNIVELRRVRELREFQRRFANYKAEINNGKASPP